MQNQKDVYIHTEKGLGFWSYQFSIRTSSFFIILNKDLKIVGEDLKSLWKMTIAYAFIGANEMCVYAFFYSFVLQKE